MTDGTGAMQQFDSPAAPGNGRQPSAGLVLLYAEGFAELPVAWPLTTNQTRVGREPPSEVCVNVHAVSRVHAQITWERGGFTLKDLNSTNGTLLDGHKITEARLESGQEVRIGDAILKFVDNDVEQYGRYGINGAVRTGQRLCPESDSLVGGYQIDRIASELARIAASPLSVMLLGESGTGKEVVARELHRMSQRRGGFFAINCAAIPGNLLESELFGYKKGAFSGADRDKPGLIRAAHRGTLLLDEIGDMPLVAQAKLLRVLQSREVFPLGAIQPEPVDVRVICATHRDLKRLQLEERFREDLFARLNEYQLKLPALRDRKEDVYLLLKTFLARHGRPRIEPSFRAMTALLHYDWPYNVRELEACAKRCVALANDDVMDVPQLPEPVKEEMLNYGTRALGAPPTLHDPSSSPGAAYTPTLAELDALLRRHQGNVAAVGRELGKARMQVHRWMKRYGIEVDDYR